MDADEHYLKREFAELFRRDDRVVNFLDAGVLDGLWYWDAEQPENEWYSPRLKSVLGFEDSEVPNLSSWWKEHVHPDDVRSSTRLLKRHLKDPDMPFDVVVRFTHKLGHTVWIRCRGVAIRDDAGRATRMLGSHIDVTAMKSAESNFEQMVDEAPDGILVVNESGHIILVNKEVEKIFAYDRSELIGENVDILVPDSVRARHPDLRTGFMNDPKRRSMSNAPSVFGRRKDGSEVPVALGLSPLSYLGAPHAMASVRDVTQERYAQHALEDSEARLKEVVEELTDREEHLTRLVRSIPDAVITVDETGNVEEVNPATLDMFRTTEEKLIGKPVLNLFPPEVAKAIDVDRRNTGGLDFLKGAVMALDAMRSDGEDFRSAVSVNTFKTVGGHKFLWLLKDISIELRYEKERQSLTRALEEKNRELESIIYAASHDMRSPLVNLQGFSRELARAAERIQGALSGVQLPPESRKAVDEALSEHIPEALGFIDSSSKKMDRLIRGLLKLSRLGREQLQLKIVNMTELTQDVLRSLEFTIREQNVEIEAGDLPACVGDDAMLNQVLTNLVGNALKYLDPDRKGRIRIRGVQKSREVRYSIEDNGIGVDAAHRDRIFEVFHRLHPNDDVEGEGLGLSIVRRILDRHNGTIAVEDAEGNGARFVFVLPAPRPSEFFGETKRVSHAGI